MNFPREDYIDRANRRADLHTEAIKGMFILNGGGILALLTFFTQILVHAPHLVPLAKYVVWTISLWAIGLVALAPINHLRYETSRLYDKEETKVQGKKYGMAHRVLFYASVACFVAGLTIALVGISSLGSVQLPNTSAPNKALQPTSKSGAAELNRWSAT
jgi:hypothetical protein